MSYRQDMDVSYAKRYETLSVKSDFILKKTRTGKQEAVSVNIGQIPISTGILSLQLVGWESMCGQEEKRSYTGDNGNPPIRDDTTPCHPGQTFPGKIQIKKQGEISADIGFPSHPNRYYPASE